MKTKISWDRFDEEASREGTARAAVRDALPSVMGKRINGSVARLKGQGPAFGRTLAVFRENKLGFAA